MSAARLALISAIPASIPPAAAAIERGLPGVEVWNLLDDRLLEDANRAGALTPALSERMRRLIEHATSGGADAVLLTCSVYAPVAREARAHSSLPIYGPDDAIIRASVRGTFRSVAVVSTGAVPLQDSVARFRAEAPPGVEVLGVLAEDAGTLSRRGDIEGAAACIARAVAVANARPDVIALGQYSLASTADAVRRRIAVPTLAGPALAVEALRQRLGERA